MYIYLNVFKKVLDKIIKFLDYECGRTGQYLINKFSLSIYMELYIYLSL